MGAVVVERLMRAGRVVVRKVPTQQTSEMLFVDHDDEIEAFAANGADDALGEGVLPGRSRRDEDPQAFHPPYEHVAVDGVPIAEQILWCGLFRKALDKLVGGPRSGGVVGDVDMDQFPTVVSKNQEPEEQAEGERRNNEEVDGDSVADMRLKEGAPRRGWPRRGAPHVLGNGGPSDLITEEPKFRLDPAPPPGGFSRAMRRSGGQDRAEGDPLSCGGTSSASRAGNRAMRHVLGSLLCRMWLLQRSGREVLWWLRPRAVSPDYFFVELPATAGERTTV